MKMDFEEQQELAYEEIDKTICQLREKHRISRTALINALEDLKTWQDQLRCDEDTGE